MSRIIKNNSTDTRSMVGRAAALNIANFAEQAQKMIIEAQTKASRIIAGATGKAKELEKQAAERGYQEGLARGRADGQADGAEKAFTQASEGFRKQTGELQAMLKQTIRSLEQARNEILQQARDELLDLALAVAQKVTHVQAAGDVEVAKASLGKAIEMVSCGGGVQAKVCAAQLEQLREYAAEFLGEMGMSELVKFTGDPQLAPGDVVLVSRNGEVDARIQTQVDNIVSAITGRTAPPT